MILTLTTDFQINSKLISSLMKILRHGFPVMNDEGVEEVVRGCRKQIKSVCYYKGNIYIYGNISHFDIPFCWISSI